MCEAVDCRNTKPPPACCTNYTGTWDSSNALALLRHAARHAHPIAAVAYGNELGGKLAIGARLSAAEYAAGLGTLQQMVAEAWRGAARPAPLVLGPNAQIDSEWMRDLLRVAPPSLMPVLSHHLYPLGAGCAAAVAAVAAAAAPSLAFSRT